MNGFRNRIKTGGQREKMGLITHRDGLTFHNVDWGTMIYLPIPCNKETIFYPYTLFIFDLFGPLLSLIRIS